MVTFPRAPAVARPRHWMQRKTDRLKVPDGKDFRPLEKNGFRWKLWSKLYSAFGVAASSACDEVRCLPATRIQRKPTCVASTTD